MDRCWVEGDGLMLGQRVGLMLSRRGWFDTGLMVWFDARYKGMDGSMLGGNDGCFWRPKTNCWIKTNLEGTTKKLICGNKELAP